MSTNNSEVNTNSSSNTTENQNQNDEAIQTQKIIDQVLKLNN